MKYRGDYTNKLAYKEVYSTMYYLDSTLLRYNKLMDNKSSKDQDFFNPDQTTPTNTLEEEISWNASEYIQHHKEPIWYLIASLAIAAVAAVGFLMIRDLFTPSAIVVFGVLLLVVSSRKPRTMNYIVSNHGVVVNSKEYASNDFQSFTIVHEGPIESVILYPQKRWSLALSLYFAPEDGQKIFDMLSSFLPFEQREKDTIDKILHKVRF